MPGSLWPQPTNGLVRPLQVGTGTSTNNVHHHPLTCASHPSSQHASLHLLLPLTISSATLPFSHGQMCNGRCRSSAFEKCSLCMMSPINFLCSVASQLHAGSRILKKPSQPSTWKQHVVVLRLTSSLGKHKICCQHPTQFFFQLFIRKPLPWFWIYCVHSNQITEQ